MSDVKLQDFGLELTQNSKVGWAFSLPRNKSCIQATETCKRLCYGNGIRYQTVAHQLKRERNYRTVRFLLDKGGPELLASNLLALIDQARPIDWLAAQITGLKTAVPWTLRIHDLGDFDQVDYVQAWSIAVGLRPDCAFWFYTRSFAEGELLKALCELARLANCQGFLSIDNDNFSSGLYAFALYPGVWKLALLQEDESKLSPDLLPAIQLNVDNGQIISFPYHRAGHHVKPLKSEPLTLCPQIISSALPLQTSKYEPKPCQVCSLCLPG